MKLTACLMTLILVALPWYTATGQEMLTLEENPVDENADVRGTCANPAGTSALNVAVDGVLNGEGIMPTFVVAGRQTDFVLPNVTRASNGSVFSCLQVELNSNDFGHTVLIVNFAPNYTNVPADQEVNKTSSLALNFQLEAQGDNFTYNWTKNGVQFISNINVTVTAASISITSADCSDNGLYSVTATNHLGSDSVSFRLVVLCPPIFEAGSSPRRINVTAGQDFTINCRVTESYPVNPTITLTTPESELKIVTANPSQVFRQNRAGSYTYVCRADNTRATVNLSYEVSVAMSPTNPSIDPPTTTPSPTSAAPQNFAPSIGLIVGVVVGVLVFLLQLAV